MKTTTKLKVLQAFEDIQFRIAKSYGLTTVQSKILAVLAIEPEAVCMDELTKRTGYSLASISNAIKVLERFGMIIKTKKPGSKKIYVDDRRDLIGKMHEQILQVQQNEIEPLKNELPHIIKELKGIKESKDKKLKEQISIIKDHYDQALLLEKVLEKVKEMFHRRYT